MSSVIKERNLFQPARSKAETKTEITNHIARHQGQRSNAERPRQSGFDGPGHKGRLPRRLAGSTR